MVGIRVLRETLGGSEFLWRMCSHGYSIEVHRVIEDEVYRTYFCHEREIHSPVRECTCYEDRRLAMNRVMEEIARMLSIRKPGRSVGFRSAAQFRQMQEEVAHGTLAPAGRDQLSDDGDQAQVLATSERAAARKGEPRP